MTHSKCLLHLLIYSFGLRHYMESSNRLAMNANQTSSPYDDDILLLLDPDMILLRPVVHDFSSATEEPLLWVEGDALPTERKMVRHGNPIAQQDPFLGNEWMYGALARREASHPLRIISTHTDRQLANSF